jgi:hypothetical protein
MPLTIQNLRPKVVDEKYMKADVNLRERENLLFADLF